MTVLAAHQPNYLPWLGYFDKMRRADVFVLLDAVQYPRGQSVANRNRIRTAQGELMLTVPVSVPKGQEGKARYDEVSFADEKWKKKHLRSIEQAYAQAPYFGRLFPELARIVEPARSFCDMNVELIRWHAERLGIATRLVRMSELDGVAGRKSELVVALCQRLGADVYLSGKGAGAYNEPELLAANGVQLRYQEFEHPVYPQTGEGFVPNLAALDALFNCGGWPASLG
ncbi:MAG: WbqC family protein [Gaiellaceae bacterium]